MVKKYRGTYSFKKWVMMCILNWRKKTTNRHTSHTWTIPLVAADRQLNSFGCNNFHNSNNFYSFMPLICRQNKTWKKKKDSIIVECLTSFSSASTGLPTNTTILILWFFPCLCFNTNCKERKFHNKWILLPGATLARL